MSQIVFWKSHYKDYKKDFLLVFLLLVASGNPSFYKQSWYVFGVVIVALCLLFFLRRTISKEFLIKYGKFVSVFILIFGIQYLNLGYLSANTVFGFLLRVFIGAIIFYKLDYRFAPVFFNVMFVICLLSFPFYILHMIGGEDVISFSLVKDPKSILFYTFRPQVFEVFLRNSGMFWEPGAFQGYINLCIFLNFRRLPHIYRHNKFKLFTILLALISTQSTTGYITLALLGGIYLIMFMKLNKIMLTMVVTLFSLLCVYAYTSLDFLGEKITSQMDEAIQAKGDFDPRRFGALLFDLHYIQKNPLTGNGFSDVTRFSDHPDLLLDIKSGENLGLGNGFSSFVASAGILGMLWYLVCIVSNQSRRLRKDAYVFAFLIIFLLQGEPFLNFPFFLALPFLVLYTNMSFSPRSTATQSLNDVHI